MSHFAAPVFTTKKVRQIKNLIYDTTLEIDLNNLIENYRYFKSLVPGETKMMVMVKAFSYGLGTYEVAQELEKEGVDYLGVANILEGVEIRKAGVKTPIMVMNPQATSFDLMITNNLSPVLFSLKNLKLFIEALYLADPGENYPVHLKIDTGMHRLGANKSELKKIVDKILTLENRVRVESVFSHLAATDEPQHDNFTLSQIKRFEEISAKIIEQLDYPIDRHILNTNGIIRFGQYSLDMVRLGIGLYGVCADEKTQILLKTVSTLKTKISHVIDVPEGESIGYGRKGRADSDKKIATIPLGYADGFNRLLSNGKWEVLVNNKPAPIIGNISMDMSMIDVTGIPCELGDEVIVFGLKNTISDMAERIKTIPYELFTIISPRVKRVFYKN